MKNLLPVILLAALTTSCNRGPKPRPNFKPVTGIKYTEVKRRFNTGLVFNKQGYQLVPQFKMFFLPGDSVRMFSPTRGRYYNFKVYFDHDSVINMANSWYKAKLISRDSLVLQVLSVDDKVISDKLSNVFMTLYADSLIARTPPQKIKLMALPTAADTAFIKALAIKANADSTKFFAAHEPAVLTSKSPALQVEKIKFVKTFLTYSVDPADNYLHPEYNITIAHAFDNFSYRFSVYVDDKGNLTFKEPLMYMEDFKDKLIANMKLVINGYLKYYMQVTPGTTLGMAHTTSVILNIRGNKN